MKAKEELEMWKAQCAALRIVLAINNQFLADIAGTLYDHDLHLEEDEVLELMKMNREYLR